MIDGFVVASHNQVKKARAVPARHVPKAEGLHKKTQRSTTLMRRAVKQPAHTNSKSASEPHLATHHGNHAKSIVKHSQVNRFGFLPSRTSETPSQPAQVKIKAKATYRDNAVAQPRMPSMVSSVSHKKLEQMLDEALMRADAHKTMLGGKRSGSSKYLRKWLSLTFALIAVLAIALWLIWQNLPAVAVHVAAARAHVNAAMPAYTPEGFGFAGHLQYNHDSVTMEFKDKSDKSFSLTQSASNLNSSAIPAAYLHTSEPVQTSMIGGTTVYIYGDKNDAAWVNHGVLYNLKNSADLPADQVLKIVQGL